MKQQLEELIANGDFQTCLDFMVENIEALNAIEKPDAMIGLVARYRIFRKDKNNGLLSFENARIEENKIILELIKLLKSIP